MPRGFRVPRVTRLAAAALALATLGGGPLLRAQEASAAEAGDRPKATYPTFVHDFGEVNRGDRLRHSFVIRNEGTLPLEIQGVHPT